MKTRWVWSLGVNAVGFGLNLANVVNTRATELSAAFCIANFAFAILSAVMLVKGK